MMTLEQAEKMKKGCTAIQTKVYKQLNGKIDGLRFTIAPKPNTFELMIIPYSSVVCPFGFPTKQAAIDFLRDPDNKQMLMDAYALTEFKTYGI